MTHAPEIIIKAEELFRIGNFPVTNAVFLSAFTLVILVSVGIFFRRRIAMIPGRFQNFVEFAFTAMLDFIESIVGDRGKAEKYFPLIATVFFFILVSNWLGLLPGVGSFVVRLHEGGGVSKIPIFRSPASDLNFTLSLAVVAVFAINFFGVAAIGITKHLKKFFNVASPIAFSVGFFELISEAAKVVSFSFRLFGNIFAGEVLLTIMMFLVPYVIPLPFVALEVFVGFIQAFVFAMLITIFVSIATEEAH